ncbi:hypothetical protein EFK07_07960 [Pseudomonas putida]|uniref:Uncharacterized protein n=1 Tax=Pseudomonas putida TaxID=303 RepID=A0A3M8TFG5_PSEPU|nr:hypothetical protein EFK07_07960 [Pseudomonas putida]
MARFQRLICKSVRGHARSHRHCSGLSHCAIPVGAGKPAKRPAQDGTKKPATRANASQLS